MHNLDLRAHRPAPSFTAVGEGGERITLQDYRLRQQNLLLLLLHGPSCPHCARLAAEANGQGTEWEGWGAAVLAARDEELPFANLPFGQGRDTDGQARAAYGGPEADAVIAVLDFRGNFMDGWRLGHPEPADWREVGETVRWVAVQEPECGTCVIAPGWDDPG